MFHCSSYCGSFLSEISFFSFLPILSLHFHLQAINTSAIKHQNPDREKHSQRQRLPPDNSQHWSSTHSEEQLISRTTVGSQAFTPENLPKGQTGMGLWRNDLKPTQVLFWVKLQSPGLGSPECAFKFLRQHNSVLEPWAILTTLNLSIFPIKRKEYFSLTCRVIQKNKYLQSHFIHSIQMQTIPLPPI